MCVSEFKAFTNVIIQVCVFVCERETIKKGPCCDQLCKEQACVSLLFFSFHANFPVSVVVVRPSFPPYAQ